MTPSPEARVVRWDPCGGPPRRVAFEPLDHGQHERIEQVWSGCGYWRKVGSEVVRDVAINGPRLTTETKRGP